VLGEEERARTVVNRELNAPGLELMREFDVLDQLAGIDCPTLVCVGERDPITPVPPPGSSLTHCPTASDGSR
jgi:pimeloyl-ACP methyl ester carboxylesterase